MNTVILIGASTGGPRALQTVLRGMPPLDASIVLVQHMPEYISGPFRNTLAGLTEMQVVIATDRMGLEPGTVYIAPGGIHLTLEGNTQLRLVQGPKVCFVRPSIDVAMQSLQQKPGSRIIGVILTGMGQDGAEGITHIKKAGGITIAQDEKSSTIYGMPRAAVHTGSVDHVLPLERVQSKLISLAGVLLKPRSGG